MDKQSSVGQNSEYRSKAELVLASGSPRRSELLTQIGVNFIVLSVDIDESPHAQEQPKAYVQRLASLKAREGYRHAQFSLPALGADTIVYLDDEILGKPRDKDEALEMLEKLSGRRHQVLSAISIVTDGFQATRLSTSHVSFRQISAVEREQYWATGEPIGKAGAYAIQGRAALFIKHLEGSYSAVMGLPLYETGQLLAEIGIDPLR